MMKKVFCFGELLLRMSPELGGEWLKNAVMPVYIGGAELNVATALAKWEIPVRYCSAVPVNFLGTEIIGELESRNIDVSAMHFSGKRIGIYFLQQGADLKKTDVIYDRAGSSFSELRKGMINWKAVFKDCDWFHFSAISPAISENITELCKEALEVATAMGLTISVDLNYRSKLWQYGMRPEDVMPELVKFCHVVMGNIWAAEQLLAIPSLIESSAGKDTETLVSAAADSIQKIQLAYPLVHTTAFTFRLEEQYFGVIGREDSVTSSRVLRQENIVDRVGSGDCFMAGLIYGISHNNTSTEIINFSAAAAIGKMKEKGDTTNQSVLDIKNTLK